MRVLIILKTLSDSCGHDLRHHAVLGPDRELHGHPITQCQLSSHKNLVATPNEKKVRIQRTEREYQTNLNTPDRSKVWLLFPSGTLSLLSQGCKPRYTTIFFTASSSVLKGRLNVSSSSFSWPNSSHAAPKFPFITLWT